MARRLAWTLVAALAAGACSAEPIGQCHDCATDGDGDTSSGGGDGDPAPADGDDGAGDEPSGDGAGGDGDGDTVAYQCGEPTEVTLDRLWPEPGELFYVQLGLDGLTLGEAAVTVWPDGQIVVIDVGNDSHAADVVSMVAELVTAMNARGFAQRSASVVDHVLLTHHHADHTDGLADFLDSVTVSGRVVHRGYFDLVGVEDATIGHSCDALAARPGLELPICVGPQAAPCNSASWSGTYPADACDTSAATSLLTFGGDNGIRLLAVNGFIGTASYEDELGPFLTENNGENARSVVAVLERGPFRMLVAGDLTGGGSDTDPAEGFYAPRLAQVSDLDARGLDVLHAGHHGRDTSTSAVWADTLLPNDGRDRNVVMGVSQAHLRSPYQEVLDTLFTGNRLREGYAWTTRVATLGKTHARLLDADGGHILLRTHSGGQGYYVQALSTGGAVLWTRRYDGVRACP